MQDEDGTHMSDTSRHENSGVWLVWLGLENLLSVWLPARSGVITAASGIANWLAQESILSPGFSWWFPVSFYLSLSHLLNSTITFDNRAKSSLSISVCHQDLLTVSTAFTVYWIHRVFHTPSTASTEYCIPTNCTNLVMHTLSTAYSKDCIILILTVSRYQLVTHLSADLVVLSSLH
jgi:hypothetical protein